MTKVALTIALTITSLTLVACGEDSETEKQADKKQEYSCEDSKVEIDAVLKKGVPTEPEYWELRQIEYNQKCEDIYVVD